MKNIYNYGYNYGGTNNMHERRMMRLYESFDNAEIPDMIAQHGGLKSSYGSYDARTKAMFDLKTAEFVGYMEKETVDALFDLNLMGYIEDKLLFTNDGGAVVIESSEGPLRPVYNKRSDWEEKVHNRNVNYLKDIDAPDYRFDSEDYVVPNMRNTIDRRRNNMNHR